MKNIALTIIVCLVGIGAFAQSQAPQRLKYVTNGPDGSVAMTIYDDSRDDTMKLESANDFYKYQIVDAETNELIYASDNKGKTCEIDKSKVAEGTYNLRLYTSKFVIASKITVSASRKLASTFEESVAITE